MRKRCPVLSMHPAIGEASPFIKPPTPQLWGFVCTGTYNPGSDTGKSLFLLPPACIPVRAVSFSAKPILWKLERVLQCIGVPRTSASSLIVTASGRLTLRKKANHRN